MKTRVRVGLINGIFIFACVIAAIVYLFNGYRTGSFSNDGFMPHGHCYLWTPSLVWTMVVSDLLIGFAYVSISVCLYILVRRIRLPFSAMFLAFGAFIAACGCTHFMDVYTLWFPNYWLAAFLKVITAIASVATALIMFPLFPRVVEVAAAARLSEERKKQLEAANKELERRGEELLTLNRELEAFSYSVAHDLRTPLRGINGFSHALKEDYADKLDAQAKEYLEYIGQGSEKMGKLIDDLLNLARVTRREIRKKDVDLSQFAKDAAETLRLAHPKKQVDLFIQEGVNAEGDPGLLRIVIDNLIANAWKFTDKAIGARIEFGTKTEDGLKIYFVRDNGAGFDMTYAGKLFGAFQRLHSADEYEGTGIGLATAKRIVTRHDGAIWAESETGKGSTFSFTLGGKPRGRA